MQPLASICASVDRRCISGIALYVVALRMGPGARGALLAALLLLAGAAGAWPTGNDQSPPARLARWLLHKGGVLNGIKVRRACAQCERGVFATRDFAEGDVIARVPFEAMIKLTASRHDHPPDAPDQPPVLFSAEYARDLLSHIHHDFGWNSSWGAYWEALPGPDEVFSAELFTDEQLAMLQSKKLEALTRHKRDITVQIYSGNFSNHFYTPFDTEVPTTLANLETFKYVSSLLATRGAAFEIVTHKQVREKTDFLPPILDMMNHADDANCVWYSDDHEHAAVVKAKRAIRKGEEVTSNYQARVIHRPDLSLFMYGFVTQRQEPLMAATDLPTYTPRQPFARTPADDRMYDGVAGTGVVTQKELDRLRGLLAEAPTTAEEDQALLDGGSVTDWRERTILQFRVQRKRALQRAVDKLVAALQGQAAAQAESLGEL